jgi:hypothetical protein
MSKFKDWVMDDQEGMEELCMDCNEEKAVMIEHNVLHYCAKCMWKQQERNDKKREAWKNRL